MNQNNVVQNAKVTLATQTAIALRSLTAILSVLVMTCSIGQAGTRHGDVTLTDNRGGLPFLPEAADWLTFPDIPIGKSLTLRYRVRALPQVIYPSGFNLEVPASEYVPLQNAASEAPWRHCIIRASLTTPGGVRFFSQTITLGKGRRGAELKGTRSKIFFSFTDYEPNGTTKLPHHLSYDLQIEVLQPSLRASDKLTVDAFTELHARRR